MLDFILILISIILFFIASIVAGMPLLASFFAFLFCSSLGLKICTARFKNISEL